MAANFSKLAALDLNFQQTNPKKPWDRQVLPFIYQRFFDYRMEKQSHGQWDEDAKGVVQNGTRGRPRPGQVHQPCANRPEQQRPALRHLQPELGQSLAHVPRAKLSRQIVRFQL